MFDFVYFINIKENKYGFKFSMDLMKTAERIYFVEYEFLLEDNIESHVQIICEEDRCAYF